MKFALCFLIFANFAFAKYDFPASSSPVQLSGDTLLLKQISKSISAIAEPSQKALVFISVSKTFKGGSYPPGMIDPFEFFFGYGEPLRDAPAPKQEGLGSGFIVDLEKGYILTNNHVVEGADEIHLKLANDESYPAKIIGRDKNTDVAVVQVKDPKFNRKGLSALILGDSDSLKVGHLVVALGAPFRLEASITLGIVSAMGRGSLQITRYGDFIQTDAAINPGNSGGPLIDMDGKVIGINTAIFSKSGGYNGIGFTIPSNLVREVATSLINNGSIERGYLGVIMEPLRDEWFKSLNIPETTSGVIVNQVAKDSPAEKAGLESGDVIVAVNGAKLRERDGSDLANTIGLMKPNTKIDLEFYREGKKKNVSVTVAVREGDKPLTREELGGNDVKANNNFGLAVELLTPKLKEKFGLKSKSGLVITGVVSDSIATRARLQPGDLLINANGRKISNVSQFQNLLKSADRMILLHVERRGEFFLVPLSSEE